jgi:hypothetical protein
MSNVTKPDEMVIQYENTMGNYNNVPFVKFKSEIVMEYSSTPTPVPIGMADNTLYFFKDKEEDSGNILWEIDYDDGECDEVGMGIWFEGNNVTGYDGVFELSEYSVKFLQLLGYNTEEIE